MEFFWLESLHGCKNTVSRSVLKTATVMEAQGKLSEWRSHLNNCCGIKSAIVYFNKRGELTVGVPIPQLKRLALLGAKVCFLL